MRIILSDSCSVRNTIRTGCLMLKQKTVVHTMLTLVDFIAWTVHSLKFNTWKPNTSRMKWTEKKNDSNSPFQSNLHIGREAVSSCVCSLKQFIWTVSLNRFRCAFNIRMHANAHKIEWQNKNGLKSQSLLTNKWSKANWQSGNTRKLYEFNNWSQHLAFCSSSNAH